MISNSVNNLDVIIFCICPIQFPIHPVPCQTICRTLGLLCERRYRMPAELAVFDRLYLRNGYIFIISVYHL